MKVFNLHCALEHVFEGWFASEQDFVDQQARGLIACPLCDSTKVRKGLSAPRLNLGRGAAAPAATAAPSPSPSASDALHAPQALQAAWLQMARQVMAHTEDVGPRFAEEARRMHRGDIEERGIRGQTTPEEAQALREEGVPVLRLPLPEAAKETLQ